MRPYLIITFCLYSASISAQINYSLKKELDSMFVLDQRYRGYLSKINQNKLLADSLKTVFSIEGDLTSTLWEYQTSIDSLNLRRAEEIIKQYGYPGKSVVGVPTNEAIFYVIQHSPKIESYFPVIQKAARADQMPFHLAAMMEDRLLTEQMKPQIYGTQVACYPLKGNFSKQECFVWPVKDPNGVNQRRMKAGFTKSIEDNAKRLGVQYEPLTMKEAKNRYTLDTK